MRSKVAVAAVGLLLVSSTPADAGLGGLVSAGARAAARGAAPAARGAGAAARGAGAAGRAATHIPHVPATPAAIPRVVVPKGPPRAVTMLDPPSQRTTAMLIVTRTHADDPVAVALRSSESSPSITRTAADVEEGAAKKRLELLQDILETSADAAGSILDSDDAVRGDVDPDARPAMVDAEWQRHAQRLKRISQLSAHALDDKTRSLVANVKAKEERRHRRMLELLDGNVFAEGDR